MNRIRNVVVAIGVSLLPVIVNGQCVDGVCRLPAGAAEDRDGLRRLTQEYGGRNPAYLSRSPGADRDRDELDCRDGVCRIRAEHLSDCPNCDCDGKYCTCGPDCPSHYQSRNGLARDDFRDLGRQYQSQRPLLDPFRSHNRGVTDGGTLGRDTRSLLNSERNHGYRPGDAGLIAPRPQVDPFRPVSQSTRANWLTDYEQAVSESRRSGRPLLIRVSASWCQYCERMNRETYVDRDVVRDINGSYVAVSLDGDRDRRLVQQLGVKTLPTLLVVTPDLRIVDRVEGFRTARQLTQTLGRFSRRAMRETGFKMASR